MSAPVPVYWLEATQEELVEEIEGGRRSRRYWIDTRTGKKVLLDEAEPGAVWNADWLSEHVTRDKVNCLGSAKKDGLYLCCKLPNGRHWAIDGLASNCTRPTEVHSCWCRHGSAKDGTLHVDKKPEPGDSTCAAGAGSIWVNQGQPDEWHGHLHGGKLVRC